MLESSAVLSRMFCANSSDQSRVRLWIPTAPVVRRNGPSANASDETGLAALAACVKSLVFNQFPEISLRHRLWGGPIG
jgi:hypothetical protein